MPSSETPAAPLAPSPKLAGAGRRGIQFLLDYLSIVIVSGASLALFLLLPTNDDGSIEGGATVIAVMLVVALVSIGWSLWVWCWRPLRNGGQTYAMSALGLRVEKLSGEPMTFWTLFVRMLFLAVDVGITPLIGWITIAASASKQRVGDMVAKTIVTRTD
jgi:uncharacterized RDD family membrane protein YckC